MRIYQAVVSAPARIRMRKTAPAEHQAPVIEFAAENDHDAFTYMIGHLNARFPKAAITSFDFSLKAL